VGHADPGLERRLVRRALPAERQPARNKVERALHPLNHDHRGARAWLRELA